MASHDHRMATTQRRATPLIRPMLATAGPLPPPPGDDAEWAYELKWDGVRAVAYLGARPYRLLSRTDQDMTSRYPELAPRRRLPRPGTGPRRRAGRAARREAELQSPAAAHAGPFPTTDLVRAVPVVYFVFDVLHHDGQSLWPDPRLPGPSRAARRAQPARAHVADTASLVGRGLGRPGHQSRTRPRRRRRQTAGLHLPARRPHPRLDQDEEYPHARSHHRPACRERSPGRTAVRDRHRRGRLLRPRPGRPGPGGGPAAATADAHRPPEPWSIGVRLRNEPEGVHRLWVQPGSAADGCTRSTGSPTISRTPGSASSCVTAPSSRCAQRRPCERAAMSSCSAALMSATPSPPRSAVKRRSGRRRRPDGVCEPYRDRVSGS